MSTIGGMSSTLRMTGLASGLDTDTMVRDLMKAERMRYNKLHQQKTLALWRQDAYREVNNLFRAFKDTYMSVLKPESNMLSSSNYLIYKATVIDNGAGAGSGVRITGSSNAIEGTYTIDSVTQLACGAHIDGSAGVSGGAGLDTSTVLKDLPLSVPLSFVDNKISFSINGEVFTFNDTDTLGTVFSRVNSSADAGATMSYSSLTDCFTISSKESGSDSGLVVENLTGNAVGAGSAFGVAAATVSNGRDAVLSINGTSVTRSSNKFTIDGISYYLLGTSATPVNFTVEQDIDAAVDKVKAFIKAYNDLVDSLQAKLAEPVNRDYPPLTEDQKLELTDSQIEQWEKMAKSGLLNNERDIRITLGRLRSTIYEIVPEVGDNALSLGIKTGTYMNRGRFYLDETRFRESLAADPRKVADIFKYSATGLVSRMSDAVQDYLDMTGKNRINTLASGVADLDRRIVQADRVLQRKEQIYYRQFAKLESALARMNSQSNWLSQNLGMQNK